MTLQEFQEYIDPFLTYLHCTKNISEHTQRAYSTDLQELIHFWQKKLATSQQKQFIINEIISDYLKHLLHQKRTATTIARKCSSFNSFEKFIKKAHQRDLNLKLVRPPVKHLIPQFLTVEEIHYLLERMSHDDLHVHRPYRDKAIFQLLYATGMLSSEIIQLQWSHVNISERTLHVVMAHKQRNVSFSEKTAQKLEDYVAKERKKMSSADEYFFLNYHDEPLTTRSIQRICSRFSKGLSRKISITPFILRYSCAHHLLSQGKTMQELQEILGHRCSVSTERYFKVFKQLR
jgi:site-specific recombinase XerD